jgi:hypothetical protein
MCQTRDGGYVVDVDEALRKFGAGARLKFWQELAPKWTSASPYF